MPRSVAASCALAQGIAVTSNDMNILNPVPDSVAAAYYTPHISHPRTKDILGEEQTHGVGQLIGLPVVRAEVECESVDAGVRRELDLVDPGLLGERLPDFRQPITFHFPVPCALT